VEQLDLCPTWFLPGTLLCRQHGTWGPHLAVRVTQLCPTRGWQPCRDAESFRRSSCTVTWRTEPECSALKDWTGESIHDYAPFNINCELLGRMWVKQGLTKLLIQLLSLFFFPEYSEPPHLWLLLSLAYIVHKLSIGYKWISKRN